MKQSIVLAVVALLRLACVVLTQAFVVARLGVGLHTDALVAAAVLPQLLISLAVAALNQVLVPLFTQSRDGAAGGNVPAYSNQSVWTVFIVLLAICAGLYITLVATAQIWFGLLSPGFTAEGLALATSLARIQMIGIVFAIPFSAIWANNCAQGKLLRTELVSFLASLVALILTVLYLPALGVAVAAIVFVLRSAIEMFVLLPTMGRWRGVNLRLPILRDTWHRARYLMAGSAYYGTESLVNQVLTSFAPHGSLSVFFLGLQLYNAQGLIISRAIGAPASSALAQSAHQLRWRDFRAHYRSRMIWIFVIQLLTMIGLIVIGLPLMQWAARFTRMSSESVTLLWLTLVALIGVGFGNISFVTLAAYSAVGDTRTPTLLGIISYTIYLPIKVAAFFAGGIIGLAVASSLFFLVNTVGQIWLLERKIARNMPPAMSIDGVSAHTVP